METFRSTTEGNHAIDEANKDIIAGVNHHFNNQVGAMLVLRKWGAVPEDLVNGAKRKLINGLEFLLKRPSALVSTLTSKVKELKTTAERCDWNKPETYDELVKQYYEIVGGKY